jgi:hypothetical protein
VSNVIDSAETSEGESFRLEIYVNEIDVPLWIDNVMVF